LAKFFWGGFKDVDGDEVHFHAKITRPIFRHLDGTSLLNKGFIIWGTAALEIFFLA